MISLSIIIPCKNEEETIGICVYKALSFLKNNGIEGEVVVVDNNSTDDSRAIAVNHGAKVIYEPSPGYGQALITGINNASGSHIIIGDADNSYDFSDLSLFINAFNSGYEFINGNRFLGGIEKHAMSLSHKLGVPMLSFIGRIFTGSNFRDFHCGLRGFTKEAFINYKFESTGMEFATELIGAAQLLNLKTLEIPIKLHKDSRQNTSAHIRTIRDGFRHLFLIIRWNSYTKSKKLSRG